MATSDDRTTEGPDTNRPTAGRVSRRVVASGLAWSVPAVVVASAAPAMAASGVAPLLQLVAPCVNPAGACAGRGAGYGFLVRVCGQGPTAYLYSVAITSAEIGDLTFDSIEPSLGRPITSGNCTNTFVNARTATLPPATFTATISVTWGHNPTIGSDPDHPAVVLSVPVSGGLQVCVCPPR